MAFAQELLRRAAGLGVRLPSDAVEGMERHYRLLVRWNPTAGLTSVIEEREVISRHFLESLAAVPYLPPAGSSLIDIGTGNGFPAIPLLVLRPDLRATLLEPATRKWGFLKEVTRATGLAARVRVLRRRVEAPRDLASLGPVDAVTVRAVGGLGGLLAGAAEFLAPGGRVLLWAGADLVATSLGSAGEGLEVVARCALPGRDSAILLVLGRPR